MRRFPALLALLAPSVAFAVPMTLSQSGRLLDEAGVPLEGSLPVVFSLHATDTDVFPVWTETQDVAFDNGYYAVTLGETFPFTDTLSEAKFLRLKVGDTEIPAAIPVNSVPFAIFAGTAASLKGGSVDATEIKVGGATVIGADGKIDFSSLNNAPADQDSFALLTCEEGEILVAGVDGWDCAPLEIDAAAITTGTLDISRIPVGSSAGTVASGDHAHGDLYYAKAEVDSAISTAIADAASASAADPTFTGTLTAEAITASGAVTAGSISTTGEVTAGSITTTGTVKIGGGSATCDAGAAGSLRFNSALKVAEVCDGTGWRLAGDAPLTGTGANNNPWRYADDSNARTCLEYLDRSRTYARGDGWYRIDPDGSGSLTAVPVWCDMRTEGGGWTRIDYAADLAFQRQFTNGDVTQYLPTNFATTLSAAHINALRTLATEGKQRFVVRCENVIVWYYNADGTYQYAFGFRFHDNSESVFQKQHYWPLPIEVVQDECRTNGGEGGALDRSTVFDLRGKQLPVVNVRSRDAGDAGESFGSPLTTYPAWLR